MRRRDRAVNVSHVVRRTGIPCQPGTTATFGATLSCPRAAERILFLSPTALCEPQAMLIAIRRSVESYCGRSGLVNQAAMQRYPCSPALNADGNEALLTRTLLPVIVHDVKGIVKQEVRCRFGSEQRRRSSIATYEFMGSKFRRKPKLNGRFTEDADDPRDRTGYSAIVQAAWNTPARDRNSGDSRSKSNRTVS